LRSLFWYSIVHFLTSEFVPIFPELSIGVNIAYLVGNYVRERTGMGKNSVAAAIVRLRSYRHDFFLLKG
jgi:hypothetical protein